MATITSLGLRKYQNTPVLSLSGTSVACVPSDRNIGGDSRDEASGADAQDRLGEK